MNGQWAVVVGAGLGASGAIVGAVTAWAGTRLQARTQLNLAQAQQIAQHDIETTALRRSAHAELILSVDTCRRQMRRVRRHVQGLADGEDGLGPERAAVHERIREAQAAEWVLRLMLSEPEQQQVTDLMNAVYTSHQALIDDVDEWLDGAGPGQTPPAADTERYARAARGLQQEMMRFAGATHTRLYGPGAAVTALPARQRA
ncbi:hypothetical protein ACWEFL_29440 [Streptomyces sp. NPDC004838]